jgi:hypothetical protein
MKMKLTKRAEAVERQAAYNKLTVAQKLKSAKSRPGNSKKEVARLSK